MFKVGDKVSYKGKDYVVQWAGRAGYDLAPGDDTKNRPLVPASMGNEKLVTLRDEDSRYILWNKASTKLPTATFHSRASAIKVAYSMAAKEPGQTFHVCKIVGEVTCPKPEPKYTEKK